MAIGNAADLRLVRDAVGGSADAWERLVRRIADGVWTACLILEGDDAAARASFALVLDGLRTDGFRRLRPYDGSSRIDTFAILLTREILIQRLLRQLAEDRGRAWAALEHFFAADIRRILARRLPGALREEARRDAYQEICLRLVEDDCRRLRAYQGTGSFGGFVLHMVDRLTIDMVRREAGRGDTAERPRPVHLDDGQWQSLPCPAPSPEQQAQHDQEQDLLVQASSVLAGVVETLPPAEALYLRVALDGAEPLPAREIARLMARPVAEVYKIKQRVMARLHHLLADNPAVKKWRESV